jgi:hypothetical protein
MTRNWHDWRPAIWLTMIGVALMLLLHPFFVGALFIGAGIGAGLRIRQRRRRRAIGAAARPARIGRRRR